MRRATLLSITLFAIFVHPALGGQFDYDFSGVLSDHFVTAVPNPNSSLTQNDVLQQLEYSVPGGHLLEENGTGISHLHFTPRYDQPWRAAVDVKLPSSYDNSFLTNNPANTYPNGDSWLELGLIAASDFSGGEVFALSLALEPNGSSGPQRIFLGTDEAGGTDGAIGTSATSTRLSLEFDATSKQLSGFAGNTLVFSSDLGPGGSDWGMTDSDTFSIVLFGSTGFQEVTADNPLVHDNFTAVIIPEPSAWCLLLVGFSSLWLMASRTSRLPLAPNS